MYVDRVLYGTIQTMYGTIQNFYYATTRYPVPVSIRNNADDHSHNAGGKDDDTTERQLRYFEITTHAVS